MRRRRRREFFGVVFVFISWIRALYIFFFFFFFPFLNLGVTGCMLLYE